MLVDVSKVDTPVRLFGAEMESPIILAPTGGPTWFQLYVQKDRGFTKALVQRAEEAGCRNANCRT